MARIAQWTTKKGEHLLISEMDKSHIKNCIHMLMRKIELEDEPSVKWAFSQYIKAFEDELVKRRL